MTLLYRFGIAETLARSERLEALFLSQRAAPAGEKSRREPEVPMPLPPPVKSSRFPTESSFADYVAALLNGWRGLYAISRRNIVMLIDSEASVVAVCVVCLAPRNEHLAPEVFKQLLEMRKLYPRKRFMIATLGGFDAHALDRLEIAQKTRIEPSKVVS